MPEINLKAHVKGMISHVAALLTKDLNAIEETKRNEAMGGVSRAALPQIVECGAANTMFAKLLRDEEIVRLSPEDRAAFYASFDTTEKTLAFFQEQTQGLLNTIDGLSDDALGEEIETPLGLKMSRFGVAEFAALHMMYHDGQLNYIHTLHGDTEMHW